MATQRILIFGPQQDAPARRAAGSLRLAPTVKNDVFLNALLEMPTTQRTPDLRVKLRLGREEALNGHVSIDRCSNDYGFSLLHRSRRVHSPQVSQVNRVFAGGFGLGSPSRCDRAISPALRGHRLSF
jgi:hypothetical protein